MWRISGVLTSVAMAATLVSCAHRVENFVLDGNIEGVDSTEILLTGIDYRFDRVDTISVKEGTFHYECQLDTITPVILVFKDGRQEVIFAENTVETAFFMDENGNVSVNGGEENTIYRAFLSSLSGEETSQEMVNLIDSLIVSDPSSEVVPYLIYRYCLSGDVDKKTLSGLIEGMNGQMKDNAFISSILNNVSENIKKATVFRDRTVFDTAMVRTELKDIIEDDNVLFYFWASWDKSHKEEIDSLKAIWKDFSDRQFHIVGFSLDTQQDRWKQTIREDSLSWEQYSDFKGPDSNILTQFAKEIPYYILVRRITGTVVVSTNSTVNVRKWLDTLEKNRNKRR